MQKATRRHEEFQSSVQLLAHRRAKRTTGWPIAQFAQSRDECEPSGHVVIAQPAGSLFEIRLQVKNRLPELCVPLSRHLSHTLEKRLRFPRYQLGNQFVMQPREQLEVSHQITAIQQRDGEFGVGWIEAVAF